jgi:hypothetical protein
VGLFQTGFMQLAVTVMHHDHSYVERRGGHVLYSFMRHAPSRAAYRRAAIVRAHDRWQAATTDGTGLPLLGGIGLLVLQRAFLAAEDLGRLIVGLDGEPSWARLTTARLPALDQTFVRVLTNPDRALQPFCLPSPQQLLDERLDSATRDGAERLAQLAAERWLRQLQTVAHFWGSARPIAKATMHGFPILAGSLVTGPPPAGALTDGLRVPSREPWVLALNSEQDVEKRRVATTSTPLPVDEAAVSHALRAGKAAVRLAVALCAAQASSIERGCAVTIPLDLLHRLPVEQRAALEHAQAEQARERSTDA